MGASSGISTIFTKGNNFYVTFQKESTLKGKNLLLDALRGANSFLLELIPVKKGCKNEND